MTERRERTARQLGLTRATGEAYYHRGLKAYADGDLENAILDLSEAIFHDRNYAEYYSTRGLFYAENNQPKEAEIDLKYALTLGKRQWLAHYALGMLRFREGNLPEAVDHLTDALKFGSDRPEVWFYRAVAYYHADEFERAATDIDQAVRLFRPDDERHEKAVRWKREIDKKVPGLASGSSPAKGGKKRRTATE